MILRNNKTLSIAGLAVALSAHLEAAPGVPGAAASHALRGISRHSGAAVRYTSRRSSSAAREYHLENTYRWECQGTYIKAEATKGNASPRPWFQSVAVLTLRLAFGIQWQSPPGSRGGQALGAK